VQYPTLFAVILALVGMGGCAEHSEEAARRGREPSTGGAQTWTTEREAMVRDQIQARGVDQPAVLEAMRKVPRHLFVPEGVRPRAYEDSPLPIGVDQTISQPYIVALMTSLLDLDGSERVLEVGTGSGYQAAVLAEIVDSVYTIEIVQPLAERARETLRSLGYGRVEVRAGDGYEGWAERGPFDGIVVTCAPRGVPPPLIEQLAEGGRLVIPYGERWFQELVLIVKEDGQVRRESILPVRFVPLTGPHARN